MQQAGPSLFFSFAGDDRQALLRFTSRLKAQEVRLWDYSEWGSEVPGGHDLRQHLCERIARSDVVVVVVSSAALTNDYTRAEVQYAIECKRRMIPIRLPRTPQVLSGPYRTLEALRYYELSPTDQQDVEEKVARICRDVGVAYRGLPGANPRLPVFARVFAEIDRKVPKNSERSISVHARLELLLGRLISVHESGDMQEALSLATFVAAVCEHEFGNGLYYPHIVKAVCAIDAGQLETSLTTLERLRSHPELDESYFAAMGYARYRQGLMAEAFHYFQLARERDPRDPGPVAWLLNIALEAAIDVDVDALVDELDRLAVPSAAERELIEKVKAIADASRGRPERAAARFRALVGSNRVGADALVRLAWVLLNSDQPEAALRELQPFEAQLGDSAPFLQALAEATWRTGNVGAARLLYDRLASLFPRDRHLVMEAAQFRWTIGERQAARALAAQLLEHVSMPRDSTAFYYDGMANWMVGKRERAEYDFTRAGWSRDRHYSLLLGHVA